MIFKQIPVGDMQNFAYLIGDETTKTAFVFDVGFDAEKIFDEAQKLSLKIDKIFLTHFHYDHSGQADKLASLTNAEIFAHENGEKKRDQKDGFWVIPKKFHHIKNDQEFKLGNIIIKVILTPGHQNDHFSFLINDDKILTGDALFVDGVGRTDLPDSDDKKMKSTLDFFASLKDEVIIFPGHDYGDAPFRTIGEEKHHNKALLVYYP